jgi:hypothetical protein
MALDASVIRLAMMDVLVVTDRPCRVESDNPTPGGTIAPHEAIARLDTFVTAQELSLDNHARGLLRLLADLPYQYGPYAGLIAVLAARASALNP